MKYTKTVIIYYHTKLLIIMSTSPTYIAMVAWPYYVRMCFVYNTQSQILIMWSNFMLFTIQYQHHSNQTWLVMLCVPLCVCTIVRWLCHSGQVQDLAVGFDPAAAAAAVVMACPAMWYSKMVGFGTHSSLESYQTNNPASFHLLSIFSPPPSTVHLHTPLWHPVPLGMFAVAETLQCIWDPPVCSGSFVLCTILAAWQ